MRSGKITTFIILLLLILVVNKSPTNIRTHALGAAEPALKTANTFSKISQFLKPKKTKENDDEALRTKVKILEARLASLEELNLENERLRRLLGFKNSIDYETIPARVIARDPSNWTNIVYIDMGSSDGIMETMGVTTDLGIAGKVIETAPSLSKVLLINDPDSRVAATVQRTREPGLLCGTLSRRCRMIYISPDGDAKVGDVVVTSASSQTFAEGLLIGKIVDIFLERGGLYKSAIIKPAADLERLEEVLCIK